MINIYTRLKKENFNVGLFSDTIAVRTFKFCMNITVPWVYIFIVDLMTLAVFQGVSRNSRKVEISSRALIPQYDLYDSGVHSREINKMFFVGQVS